MTAPKTSSVEPESHVSQVGPRQSALVGWLLSGCLHLTAIALILFVIQGQRRERVGFGNGVEGSPGLVMIDAMASDGGLTQEAAPSEQGNGNRPLRNSGGSRGADREVQSTELPAERPPVPLFLPQAGAVSSGSSRSKLPAEFSPTAGTGSSGTGSTGTGNTGDLHDLIEGTGTRQPGNGLGAATPGTSFMGIKDQGSRVVFVIDCSGSMTNYNAMRVAKTALVSSLQALDTGQQFQIIFYNDSPTFLKGTTRDGKATLWFATEINKTLATQQISAVQPDRGTQHLPALKLALKFSPEVIYFLTDADEPELTSIERKELIRLNQGRSRIHTIEFGQGPELKTANFLKKVAQENGGSYRYEDVTRFTAR